MLGFEMFEKDNYKDRLQHLSRDESSSLSSFKDFFINGPTPRESLTLCSIKKSVAYRLSKLSGMLSKHDAGWQLYGKKDSSNGVHFAPQKFCGPLPNVMEYQRMFSQTQVLSCYFEERKNAFMEINEDRALFIADWTYFHWWKYQKMKQN